MKQTIYENQFIDAFVAARPDNFSYDGLRALFNYFEEYQDDTGCEIELDVIAICCEFSEYEDLEDAQGSYPDIETIEDLQDHTQVIEFSGGIIIQDY